MKIDIAMEARAERKTELTALGEAEMRKKLEEKRLKKAKLKQMALRGPAVPVRQQRRPKSASGSPPTSYKDTPSPNRYVPSTSNFKAFMVNSSERAKQRAKFDVYLKEKEIMEAAREREMRVLEEKEEEKAVKELRKSMEFKATPKPSDEIKFSPKNLRYLEQEKEGAVKIKDHVREREHKRREAQMEEELREKERQEREYKELRKAMSSFKARKMPDFNKKPFSPVLNGRKT